MPTTLPALRDVDSHEQDRRLTITTTLRDRAAVELEELDHDRTLSDEQRDSVNAALELVLIAREEIEPFPWVGLRPKS